MKSCCGREDLLWSQSVNDDGTAEAEGEEGLAGSILPSSSLVLLVLLLFIFLAGIMTLIVVDCLLPLNEIVFVKFRCIKFF